MPTKAQREASIKRNRERGRKPLEERGGPAPTAAESARIRREAAAGPRWARVDEKGEIVKGGAPGPTKMIDRWGGNDPPDVVA